MPDQSEPVRKGAHTPDDCGACGLASRHTDADGNECCDMCGRVVRTGAEVAYHARRDAEAPAMEQALRRLVGPPERDQTPHTCGWCGAANFHYEGTARSSDECDAVVDGPLQHQPDCPWGNARAILARIDGEGE